MPAPDLRTPRKRGQKGFLTHFNGINEGRKTSAVPDEDLLEAVNVDLNTNGSVSRRAAVQQIVDFYTELTYYPAEVFGAGYLSQYSGNRKIIFAIPTEDLADGVLYTFDFGVIAALAGTWGVNYRYDFQVFADDMYIADATGKIILYNGVDAPARLVGATVPNANYMEEYKNYMILAGDPAAPNTIYVSELGDVTQYLNSFLAGSDEQEVVGIKKWNNRLFIFKTSSIYELVGSSLSNFTVQPLTDDYGMIFPFAMDGDDNGMYFVSSAFEIVRYNGTFEVISGNLDTMNNYSSYNDLKVCNDKVVLIPNLANVMPIYHKLRDGFTKYDLKRPSVSEDYNFGFMFNMIKVDYYSDLGLFFLFTTKGINRIEFVTPTMQSLADNNVFGNYFKEHVGDTFNNSVAQVCGADDRYTDYLDPGIVMASQDDVYTITMHYSRNNGSTFTDSATTIAGTSCLGLTNLFRQTAATAFDWTRYLLITNTNAYYSADYGATWASVRASVNMNALATMWDDDNDKLYIVINDADHIYTSIDYGANWVDAGALNAGTDVADIVALEGGVLVAISGTKTYVSDDYGLTWTLVSTTTLSGDLYKLAYDGTYVLAVDDTSPYTRVYRSADSGVTWSYLGQISEAYTISGIYGHDDSFLINMGVNGIYYSTDGGSNYTKSDLITVAGLTASVNDMRYCNSMIILAFETNSTQADSVGKILYQNTNKDVVRDPDYGYTFFLDIVPHILTNDIMLDDRIERKLQKIYIDGLLESGTITVYDNKENQLASKSITGSNLGKMTRVKCNRKLAYRVKISADDGNSNFVLTKLGVQFINKNEVRTV